MKSVGHEAGTVVFADRVVVEQMDIEAKHC